MLVLAQRVALCVLIVFAAAACDGRSQGGSAALRVISLSPNTTETVFALGAGELLVGRSRFCDYPAQAKGLPTVGGFSDPSVETIIGLRPTLVIGARSPAGPALGQSLSAHGIATYFPRTESIADIRTMIGGAGARLKRAPQAGALSARVAGEVDRVVQAVASRPQVRAIMVFDASPTVLAGPGGFPDELLRLAGGTNLIDRGGMFPTVGLERLLALDPDVIIDATRAGMGGAEASSDAPSRLPDLPGWIELRAVRDRRVVCLQGSTALRPGPRIGAGLARIAEALHGRDVLR